MNSAARLGGWLAAGLLLGGCETTGDPNQGGLFGWSETKARQRQGERQQRVTTAEHELAGENARSHALETHNTATDRDITSAKAGHEQAEAKLRAQQTELLAKIDRLETESPTPATSSRARTYRQKVNTIVAQTALTITQRSERLRAIEADVDRALERLRQ